MRVLCVRRVEVVVRATEHLVTPGEVENQVGLGSILGILGQHKLLRVS